MREESCRFAQLRDYAARSASGMDPRLQHFVAQSFYESLVPKVLQIEGASRNRRQTLASPGGKSQHFISRSAELGPAAQFVILNHDAARSQRHLVSTQEKVTFEPLADVKNVLRLLDCGHSLKMPGIVMFMFVFVSVVFVTPERQSLGNHWGSPLRF